MLYYNQGKGINPKTEKELKKMNEKYNRLVKRFTESGFTEAEARREVEIIIRYNTTGLDAVSREYAIEMMYNDMFDED